MQKINAQQLLEKFQNGECSEEELAIIESWYNQVQLSVPEKLTKEEWTADVSGIYQTLEHRLSNPQRGRRAWYRFAAAASVLIALCMGGYLLITKPQHPVLVQNRRQDILPGGNRALLTLSNGKQIVLTNARNGHLAAEGTASINKTADGQLAYTADGDAAAGTSYNSLSTPLGGQYALTLSDGTRVILNAASSIRYPTQFSGAERKIELTGEAYFEVAHNAAMPFRVVSKLQNVLVLGTHFNVNSYEDEPAAKTTLLEGSVLLNGHTRLKPGEQAISSGTAIRVINADTELAVAWKNNKFIFDNDNIANIMRMVARWYNVSIVYSGPVPEGSFGGSVSRFNNISEVLNILELTGKVHFKIEGRRVTVTK
jgi:transmembrane sensor